MVKRNRKTGERQSLRLSSLPSALQRKPGAEGDKEAIVQIASLPLSPSHFLQQEIISATDLWLSQAQDRARQRVPAQLQEAYNLVVLQSRR